MIVTAHTEADYEVFRRFFMAHGDGRPPSVTVRLIGRMDERGNLLGVVWLNAFFQRTAYIHAVGTMTSELVRAALKYMFNDCGLVQIFAPISSDNANLLKLVERLNFEELHRVPDGWTDGVDLVLMTLHRSRCRYALPLMELKAA